MQQSGTVSVECADTVSNWGCVQPWLWRSQPLEQRTGTAIFAALFRQADANQPGADRAIATLLESPGLIAAGDPAPAPLPHARYSICAGSPRQHNGQPLIWTPSLGQILPGLRALLHRPSQQDVPDPSLPFTGGWLGWLGYDLAWEIERLGATNPDPLPFPVAYWYEPACFAVLDHWTQVLWLAATTDTQLDQMQQRLTQAAAEIPGEIAPSSEETPIKPHFYTTQPEYEAMVRQAKRHIQAGDIFQANLSLRFSCPTQADSWAIYRALQQINPSPFASYWQTPWGSVISCSPERLVQLQDGQAQTRPIAGTRTRGQTSRQDRQLAQELLGNAKEQAEHVMLVDLERNDLGRVCQWGSVQVDELLTIERYSHVMHLVSNVKGVLAEDCDAIDLIRATFPGGTITGCPKVRCLEIIEELEPLRRSLFYGSCGYLDWRGNLDLNIFIRTLLYTPTAAAGAVGNDGLGSPLATVWGQVGAGIVADSDPEKEWQESLHKAQAQLAALRLTHRPVSPTAKNLTDEEQALGTS